MTNKPSIAFKLRFDSIDRQRLFFDYFKAWLRTALPTSTGSLEQRPGGGFKSYLSGATNVAERSISATWTFEFDSEGLLEQITVSSAESGDWSRPIEQAYTEILTAAFSEKTKQFFRRLYFYYFGPQLSGEYWFKSFRLSQAPIPDDIPNNIFDERVMCIDQEVNAIDEMHALTLASERSSRYSARLSTLLNVGIHPLKDGRRRLVVDFDDASKPLTRHMSTGYVDPGPAIVEMPEQGKLVPLGEFSGSMWEFYMTVQQKLRVPADMRRILNQIESLPPRVVDGFDRCCKLYQLSFAVQDASPSAALAYRVAALDALAQASGGKNFVTLCERYLGRDPKARQLVEDLWGSGRSAHFHGGFFPVDHDFGFPDSLMLPDMAQKMSLQRFGHSIIRYSLICWISERIAIEAPPHGLTL